MERSRVSNVVGLYNMQHTAPSVRPRFSIRSVFANSACRRSRTQTDATRRRRLGENSTTEKRTVEELALLSRAENSLQCGAKLSARAPRREDFWLAGHSGGLRYVLRDADPRNLMCRIHKKLAD